MMARTWIWLTAMTLAACGRTELWVAPPAEDGGGGEAPGTTSVGGSGGATTTTTTGGGPPDGVCGDGTLDPGEGCDDGNLVDADGCEADCTLPACGNGIVDPGELCFGSPYEVTQGPVLIFFGPRAIDCDADGDLDLVSVVGTGLFEPTVISVLINDGQGAFGDVVVNSPLSPTHEFYASFDVGEFDGSPGTDIAFAGQSQSSPHALRLFQGRADCRFTPYQTSALSEPHVYPRAWPVDGDDLDDLVLLRPESNSLGFGRSGDGYKVNPLSSDPQGLAPVTTGDLNGDGMLNLIQADPAAGTLLVRRTLTSSPWLGAPTAYPVGTQPFASATADVDLDGHLDVLVYDRGDDQLHRLLGDGSGSLGTVASFQSGMPANARAIDLVLRDLDADGDPDALLTADLPDGTALRARINEAGAFTTSAASLPDTVLTGEATPTTLLVEDLDGNGAVDIVVATYLKRGAFSGRAFLHVFLANP